MSEHEHNETQDEPRVGERLRRRGIVRTDARDALRKRYGDACQVCGKVTRLTARETYAEVHVLGSEADSEPENAVEGQSVVLCPEHHAFFDAGVMAIDPDTLLLHAADRENRFDGRALASLEHTLSVEALRAAWKTRVEPGASEDDGTPRLRTVEAFVEFLLDAALDPDEEAAFERYIGLVPGGRDLASAGREGHRKFAWAQLRRRAEGYVVDRDPSAFHIVSTQPSEVTRDTPVVRVMLACTGRNPAPLKLERGEDGALWLAFSGL